MPRIAAITAAMPTVLRGNGGGYDDDSGGG